MSVWFIKGFPSGLKTLCWSPRSEITSSSVVNTDFTSHPAHPKHTESLSQANLNTCHSVTGCFHNIITFAYIPCGQVEEKTCLSADELARIVGLSVIIAKQRFVIVIVIRGVLGLV